MPDEMNVVDEVNSCNKENNVEQTLSVNNKEVLHVDVVAKQVSPVKQAQLAELNEEPAQSDDVVVVKPVETELRVEELENSMETNEPDQAVEPPNLPQRVAALVEQPANTEGTSMLLQPVQPDQLNPVDLPEPVQPNPCDPAQPAVAEPSTVRKRSVRPSTAPKKGDEVVFASSSVSAPPSDVTTPAVSLPAVVEEPAACSQSATLMLNILDKRHSLKTPGESEYLVQWNDLSTTWELYETISCGDMLANFEKELSNRPSRVSSSSKSSASKRKRGKSLNTAAGPKKSLNASAKSRKSTSAMMENKRSSVELKPRSTRTSAAKAKLFIEEVAMANESSCDSPRPVKRRKVNDDEDEEEYDKPIDDIDDDDVNYGKAAVRKSTAGNRGAVSARYLPKTFIAEAIVDERMQGPIRQFLIKWQGYDDPVENTWEPAANFLRFNVLVDNFEQNRRRESIKAAGPCHSISSSTTSSAVNAEQEGSSRKKSISVSALKRLSSTPKKSARSAEIKFNATTAIQKTADANLEQEEDEEEEEKVEAIVIQLPKVPTSKQPIWRTFKDTTRDSTTVKGKNPLLFSNSLEYGMQRGLKLSCILKVTKGPSGSGSEVFGSDLVRFYEEKLKLYSTPARTKKPLQERKNNISNTNKSLDEEEENS